MSKIFKMKTKNVKKKHPYYVLFRYIFNWLLEYFDITDYPFKYFEGSRSQKYNDETVYHRMKQNNNNNNKTVKNKFQLLYDTSKIVIFNYIWKTMFTKRIRISAKIQCIHKSIHQIYV